MAELVIGASRALYDDSSIDSLVARYAAVGARQRRRQRAIAGALLAATVTIASLGTLAWRTDFSPSQLFTGAAEVEALRTLVTTELDALSASQAELQRQRVRFEATIAELEGRIAEFEGRSRELEARQAGIQDRGERLEAALAEMDAQQQALLAERATAPGVEDQIDALEARRQELEARRQEYAVQEDDVAEELGSLTQRRESLESQRQELEQQRRELEALLEQAGRGVPESPVAGAETQAQARTSAWVPPAASFSIAAVNDGSLNDMRGGIKLGDGMDISIGLTRRASLNGVDEIANTLQLDGLNRALGLPSVTGVEPLLIQSGPGNQIDAGVRDALQGTFGTILQNTLDDQHINTETIYDISIQDVSRAIDGLSAGQALEDSLNTLHQ